MKEKEIVATIPVWKGRRLIISAESPWLFLLSIAIMVCGIYLTIRGVDIRFVIR